MNDRFYLKAKTILTMDSAGDISSGVVAVEEGKIVFVGPAEQLPTEIRDYFLPIDRSEHILMPGLINTHSHSAMSLFRGLVDDVPIGQWLTGRVRAVEQAAKQEDYYMASLLGFMEMVRFGITCTADRAEQFLEITKAAKEIGIRAVLARSLRDVYGPGILPQAVHEIEYLTPHPRMTYGLGPHATDTCSVGLLKEIRKEATRLGVPIFLHVAQTEEEVKAAQKRGYAGCVDMLQQIGFLGQDVVMAHCIYISDEEIKQIEHSGAWVAHCPKSNAKIEARVFPAWKFKETGLDRITVATDAAACNNVMDLFEEMRFCAILQKVAAGDPTIFSPKRMVEMATIRAAKALGLDPFIGSIKAGKQADLITIRNGYHLTPTHEVYSNLVYCARGNDVDDVLIDGEYLVKNGRLTREKTYSYVKSEVEARSTALRNLRR